jgi:hypothetical protein
MIATYTTHHPLDFIILLLPLPQLLRHMQTEQTIIVLSCYPVRRHEIVKHPSFSEWPDGGVEDLFASTISIVGGHGRDKDTKILTETLNGRCPPG